MLIKHSGNARPKERPRRKETSEEMPGTSRDRGLGHKLRVRYYLSVCRYKLIDLNISVHFNALINVTLAINIITIIGEHIK